MFCENERESIKFGKDLLIGVEYKRYSPDPCADPYPAYPLPDNFREIDTRWEAGGRGGGTAREVCFRRGSRRLE